jgi:hypothetical protein
MVVLPQFLAETDLAGRPTPADMLRWSVTGWIDGEAATAPAPLSSFDALDAVLARLADATRFPDLRRVVVAGHAAGADLVQRYAVVGRGVPAPARSAIAVRYVLADPASYLWFGADRPALIRDAACPTLDRWRYGLAGAPAYVERTEGLEQRYIMRDVVYLLGEADAGRADPALDRSCAAAAQGPTPYARGMNYLFALEQRHPSLVRHRILTVWGAGNDAGSMLVSACGLAALFDRPGCSAF